MKLEDFDFHLPEALIATRPARPRTAARLLLAEGDRISDRRVSDRLDILRPGLLRGHREGPSRPAERVGMILAPLIDPFLRGSWSRYRSIRADRLAEVILALAGAKARGRFVHEHEAMMRALREFDRKG